MDTYKDFDFPIELIRNAECFVGFVGLDVRVNPVHKNIWELFSLNRHTDRVAVEFSLLLKDFVLPIPKPKKVSYEWYTQKGILKTNWMHKHSRLIPSVIVLFYELEWDDQKWTEKKLDCASCVHTIKTTIGERNIKIAVVLMQTKNIFPIIGEESVSTEKASELCSACDINPKLLLLLHTSNDRLQGYILRLENALYELAQTYYSQEIRNIKLHKDNLNRTTHSFLLVRHQFKIGFLNEMKHDFTAAHKHYTLANSYLLELRITETNLNEIKTVAAFITYKLCKIYFALQQPRDSINQFSAHIDRFRMKIGQSELIFEHYAWLSKQFYVFGNLFEEATRQGLPAVQTRHPGFYYEQAAQYAQQRKKLIKDLHCAPNKPTKYLENDPLVGWDQVEFYGQRPWRVNSRVDQVDPLREQLAVNVLQYREKFLVNHSAIIIDYLGYAISQFKLYRSTRKRRWLAVQMANEYYHCEEFGKALTLFSHMLWEYRNDKWWELTTDLTRKALNCAYLTANLQEYAERCVEALYLFPNEEKDRIMSNIQAIINKEQPSSGCSLKEKELTRIRDLWSSLLLPSTMKCININMHSITSFVLCKAAFGEANSDVVNLELWFRNEFPGLLTFSQLTVSISSQTKVYDLTIFEETESTRNLLELHPDEVICIPYKFVPLVSDIGSEIRMKYVSLTLGSQKADNRTINLRFSGTCSETDVVERKHFNPTDLSSTVYTSFLNVDSKLSMKIKPKISRMNVYVNHNPPNLISEWYAMDVTIKNEESSLAKCCQLHVTLSTLPSSVLSGTAPFDVTATKNYGEIFETIGGISHQLNCVIQLGDISSDGILQKKIYFRTNSLDTKNITFRLTYNVLNQAGEEVPCIAEKNIEVECVNVFEITASFLSTKCEHVSKICAEEPLLMRMIIDCVSPFPIYVKKTSFKLINDFVLWDERKCTPYLKQRIMKNKETGTEIVAFSLKDKSDDNGISLGIFSIFWRRRGDETETTVCSEVQLPHIKVDKLPLLVNVNFSSPGWLRIPTSLQLAIQNNSEQIMSFDVNVDHNEVDGIMFSGSKQMNFNIFPGAQHIVTYNLFPLQAGYVPLPYVKLTVHSDLILQRDLDDLLKRVIPSSLFVMSKPSSKKN